MEIDQAQENGERDSRKYPRSTHFLFSPGTTSDDRLCPNHPALVANFKLKPFVLTEKLDGQNNCLNSLGVFARSHGAPSVHPWDRHLWDKWELIKNDLKTLEIFGENMYATHSIDYLKLDHHYYVFGVRDRGNWLSWEEVKFYAALLDFPTVPVIYEGPYKQHELSNQYSFEGERYEKFNKDAFAKSMLAYVKEDSKLYGIDTMQVFKDLFKLRDGKDFDPKIKYEGESLEVITKIKKMDLEEKLSYPGMKRVFAYKTKEGIIGRLTEAFSDDEFSLNLRKYVRKGHVQTDEHWTRSWKRQKLSYERKFNLEELI